MLVEQAEHLVQLVRLELRALQVILVPMVSVVLVEREVLPEQLELKGLQEMQVRMVSVVLAVQLVLQGQLALKVLQVMQARTA